MASLKCILNGLFFIIVLLVSQVRSNEILEIQDNAVSIKIGEVKDLGLYLSKPVNETLYLTSSIGESEVAKVLPRELSIKANSNETIIFNITGKDAGHATLIFNVSSSEIDASSAFVSIDVYRSYPLIVFSNIVGWCYFVAWSISFYPQAVSNWRRKSVVGLNFDFLALNLSGFLAYTIYNVAFYFMKSIKTEYKELHPYGLIPIELNDVVFAIHALFATLVQIFQCFIYERGDQKISKYALGFLGLGWGGAIIFLILVASSVIASQPWLNFLYYLSYFKLVITIIKYIPQAVFNFQRKSTVGWSIGNILLDFTGGMLSILQMFFIAHNFDDWNSIFGNLAKFGLGLVSICFDLIFMWQHYVLYRGNSREEGGVLLNKSSEITSTESH